MSTTKIYKPSIKDLVFVKPNKKQSLVIDDGINYGLGFFETMLITDHCVLLKEHLQRLNASLETFNIPIRIKKSLVKEIISKYKLKNVSLKLLVTEKNIIASTRPLHYDDSFYEKGLSLDLSRITRGSHSFLVNHKSTNYGDLILSLRDSKNNGYDDCIFINEKGYICETSIANIFVIRDKTIYTPSISCGLLPGIIRRFIIENFPVVEARLTVDDLVFADQVFVTNSLMGIANVSSINFDTLLIAQTRFMQVEDLLPKETHYEETELFKEIKEKYNGLL